jgi:hypothetical protein
MRTGSIVRGSYTVHSWRYAAKQVGHLDFTRVNVTCGSQHFYHADIYSLEGALEIVIPTRVYDYGDEMGLR